MIKETTFAVLKIVIALEIWQRSFSSFPRARVRVGVLLVGALLLTAMAGVTVPEGLNHYDAFVGILNPRRQAGSLALYALIALTATWYRVPLHPLHRALAIGFAVYQTVHTLVGALFVWYGSSVWAYRWLFPLEAVGYPATLAIWAWAAWRPLRVPSPIVSRLQPWARSW